MPSWNWRPNRWIWFAFPLTTLKILVVSSFRRLKMSARSWRFIPCGRFISLMKLTSKFHQPGFRWSFRWCVGYHVRGCGSGAPTLDVVGDQ